MKQYDLIRKVPVEDGYDVVVAGGGPAGSAAAICAGRLGARVLLIEAMGCLGGMATSGQVNNFNPMADGEKMLVRGLMEEIVEMMYQRGYLPDYIRPEQWQKNLNHWTPFKQEGLKLLLDELVVKAGVEVRFFTRVIDADTVEDEKRVRGVVIHNIEGYRYVSAKSFIDATGDAVLAALCGAYCREPGRDTPYPMPSTLTSYFAGIDWEHIKLGGINGGINPALEQEAIKKAIQDGHFTQPDTHLPGMTRTGKSIGVLNGGHIFKLNALKCRSLSDGMMFGRKLAVEYMEFYRKYIYGFEHIEHVTTAVLMGVRESRRILGEYELTYEDYKARRFFHDQIGVFNNFADVHPYECNEEELMRSEKEISSKSIWLQKGESYGLPYGIIVPKGWKNLWVAGRCNSSDIMVHSAIRVQPAAVIMGQAAGTAAVQAIHKNQTADNLDTEELILTLRKAGAYLPQERLRKKMTRSTDSVKF